VPLLRDVRQVAEGWRWTRQSLVPRSAAPHTPPRERSEFPTAWARTPAARAARDVVHRIGLKPLVWSQTRPAVHGLDHLDGLAGPVLFVSNHSSHLDAPLILCSLPPPWRSRTAVGAASDYFFDARWRALGTALVFSTFPVDRHGGGGTATAAQLLAEGWSLVLFPEGTRSADGWMQGFKQGAAHLALRHGIPVVPLAIRGSYAAMPKGRSWPRPGRPGVSVRFGPPVWPDLGATHEATTGRLAAAVSRLWDEDEHDWYSSLRRAADGTTPLPEGPEAARPDGSPSWRRTWEASAPLRRPGRGRVWRRERKRP
jgi:1-acyl-sn-glycerol-3-phosphate acyltransferase